MSHLVEIVVPGDVVKALSQNQRLHFYEKHRRTQDYKSRSYLAWIAAGRPRFEGKVGLEFVIRRGRSVDSDNAISAMKACIDGLRDQPGRPAMLRDDSVAHVEIGEVCFETGARWKGREETVIQVCLIES